MLGSKRAPRIFIGQGRFSEARAQFLFIFQINSDKIRAHVVILDIRGLKVSNIFNLHSQGTTGESDCIKETTDTKFYLEYITFEAFLLNLP